MCLMYPSVTSGGQQQELRENVDKVQESSFSTLAEYAGSMRVRRGAKGNKAGIFALLNQLIAETQNDTRSAYRQITDILNENIVDEKTLMSTTPPPAVNGTTEEPPIILTRQQLLRVLRRNLRGLTRLFNQEVDMAVKDSNRNAAQARKDFREAVRPFLEPANITTTTNRP
ncbi:uncharacterized protein [Anabrus simplex]|uniref:uncharacterized protein n=1 Tax=Anabrus simplex TaxID=316456 RepID=UPI0035A36C68